jgi:hypothetical protein
MIVEMNFTDVQGQALPPARAVCRRSRPAHCGIAVPRSISEMLL